MVYFMFLLFINTIFFVTIILGVINQKPWMDVLIFSMSIYIGLNIILKIFFKILSQEEKYE